MRIYGNRLIKTLPGTLTRPTTARVREAVFNIWQGHIQGCRWLDLCCGSGSMGAEALCRGANAVIGIEQSGRACAISRGNWQRLATAQQRWQVLRGDVVRRLGGLHGQAFERIYFDPPYESGLYGEVLGAIATHNLLTPDGALAVEHAPQHHLPGIQGLQVNRTKTYGNTAVTFYQIDSISKNQENAHR